MLEKLHIENIAVIEKADLDLGAGFNILTGETGAGKSILIDSINLVLGERVSKDIIRTGAQKAHVSAFFTNISEQVKESLISLGFDTDDICSEILIQRDITIDGKSTCRILGRPVTVSMIRTIGRMLVNIHGQHDNQTLFSPEKHITYLDKFANSQELLKKYKAQYKIVKGLQEELQQISSDTSLKERKIDLLTYQINEIESAKLTSDNEELDLQAKKNRIQNLEKITSSIETAYVYLNGSDEDQGAREFLSNAAAQISNISDVYPEIKDLAERLDNLSCELEDCTEELRNNLELSNEDGIGDLDSIEERLDKIFKLKKKYGNSINDILIFLQNCKDELESIQTSDIRAEQITKRLKSEKQTLLVLARQLSELRKSFKDILSEKIQDELSFLDMPSVKFIVSFKELGIPSSNGIDQVEFLISPNPGSPEKPLSKIASGGEISRTMLAIKAVLANCEDIDTLIFDEIDTGVSGHAAIKIGNKLKEVANSRQVICITHLAQIASQADKHILIKKQIINNQTFTILKNLDYDGRKRELARIIGADITDKSLQAAGEMLELSGIKDK